MTRSDLRGTREPGRRLEALVEQGLCAGCGLCASMADGAIEMVLTPAGFLRPRAVAPLSEDTIDTLYRYCPGVSMTGQPAEARADDARIDLVWGPWLRFGRGFAADPAVRFEAASGGLLTALSLWLLQTGRVDEIVHIAPSTERPLESRSQRSATREDVVAAQGSRYVSSAPLDDLAAVLDSGRRFGLIGKPCDVAAVRNLARLDDRVDASCVVYISFVCGGSSSVTKGRDALAQWGLREADVADCRYRGGGCPGTHRVRTRDGRVFEMHPKALWGVEAGGWRIQHRCKICPDAIGEGADIVVGDAWEGGLPPAGQSEGFSSFAVRTDRGREVFEGAVGAGAVVVDRTWGPRDFDRIHPYHVHLKHSVYARLDSLRAAGQAVPHHAHLRIEALGRRNPDHENARERAGMTERVAEGRTREVAPVYDPQPNATEDDREE